MKPITDFHPDKILVCQLRQIGDVVLTTPLIRLLKKRYPNASISVFTEKKCAPVLYNNPDISDIWELDKQKHAGLPASLAFYWKIARHEYDLLVDCQQLPRCRFVTLFSRAKVRLSYPPPWYNRPFYTHWAKPVHGYAASYKASFLSPLGISWHGERPKIYLSETEDEWAENFFRKHDLPRQDGPVLTIDPTHRRQSRCWPKNHYAKLITLLNRGITDLTTILLYGPGEKAIVKDIAGLSGMPNRCIVSEHMLSLREMASVIARADLHVGNCSAPRHMAVAVDTPSLAILGSTSKAWTYPAHKHADISRGLACQPCNKDVCTLGTTACLYDLEPETVCKKVIGVLRANTKRA